MLKKSNKKVGLITILVVALTFILTTNVSAATTFKDVSKGNSHYEGITYLTSKGIINGYEDGTYKPKQKISRSQAAVLFTKALELPKTEKFIKGSYQQKAKNIR